MVVSGGGGGRVRPGGGAGARQQLVPLDSTTAGCQHLARGTTAQPLQPRHTQRRAGPDLKHTTLQFLLSTYIEKRYCYDTLTEVFFSVFCPLTFSSATLTYCFDADSRVLYITVCGRRIYNMLRWSWQFTEKWIHEISEYVLIVGFAVGPQ